MSPGERLPEVIETWRKTPKKICNVSHFETDQAQNDRKFKTRTGKVKFKPPCSDPVPTLFVRNTALPIKVMATEKTLE